jgi:hypothetical protein
MGAGLKRKRERMILPSELHIKNQNKKSQIKIKGSLSKVVTRLRQKVSCHNYSTGRQDVSLGANSTRQPVTFVFTTVLGRDKLWRSL